VRQSERGALYAAALDDLIRRRMVSLRVHAQGAGAGTCGQQRRERVYPGTAATDWPAAREGRAWRVAVTDESVRFDDRLQGKQEQQLRA
jgi:hypothetical protein